MQAAPDNTVRNIEHFDEKYIHLEVDSIVQTIQNKGSFLEEATKTDTSWYGMYQGNFASRLKGKKVLELGCGDGINSLIMAALGAEVVANDISPVSEKVIREAALELNLDNIQTISGSITEVRFESASFDFVLGKAFLHHLTHAMEDNVLMQTSRILKPDGEGRFFEPAVNSQVLDFLRWITPVPGRPSMLAKSAFEKYRNLDPHPHRNNSSEHFIRVGKKYFQNVQIYPVGSIERLCRLLPQGQLRKRFRRLAHRMDEKLPKAIRYKAARSQLIVLSLPIK